MRNAPRIAQLAVAALVGAALTGGGFALAASRSGTIHGCVARRTRELFVKRRCTRQQTALVWNQRGPTGRTGPVGPAGPQAVGAWGLIGENPTAAFVTTGQNLAATRTGVGVISVTVTSGPCAGQESSVLATPESASALGTDFPVVYVNHPAQPGPFTLTVGTVHAGTFMAQDGAVAVDVAVYCRAAG